MRTYDLGAYYDSRKSFYGKAKVMELDNSRKLFSYNTEVSKIENGNFFIREGFWNYSQTTRRHVREFAKQNDFDVKSDGILYRL